jgi:hypothetical protein
LAFTPFLWWSTKVPSVYCGATTLSIMTFSITTLSIMGLFSILSMNDTQHEILSVVMLSVDMLSVVMLNVVLLSVVAPSAAPNKTFFLTFLH